MLVNYSYATNWCENANIIACWTLEDGTGTSVTDSGGSNTGTMTGDGIAWETASPAGSFSTNYISFAGSDDYIDMGTMGSFGSGIGTATFVGWVKTTSTATMAQYGIFNTGNTTGLQTEINRSSGDTLDAGKIRAFIRDEDNVARTSGTTSDTTVNNGSWHHIAVVFYGSTTIQKLYCDGVLIDMTSGDAGNADNVGNFGYSLVYGGRNNRGTIDEDFTGDMDELAIFDDELTITEVNDIMDNGLVQSSTRRIFTLTYN